jgi:hypothetical protein
VAIQLSPEALQLLPADDEAPRCASFSLALGVAPAGTAIAAKAVALVETPKPWPKPVFTHPLLEGLSSMMDLHMGPTRVLAAEPRPDTPKGVVRVTIFERGEVGVMSNVFDVADAIELADLFGQFTDEYPSLITEYRSASAPAELAMLVCVQGSHDVCCGSDGVRFANELGIAAPGLVVFRVSHTGGHRFAPTAMTIPDGRMWAHLDVPTALSILDLTADPAKAAEICRGWWGAPTGPGQIAEVAVLAETGWDLDMMPREVSVEPTDDRWTVELLVALQKWTVSVAPGRIVPTIACRAEGGLPAKGAQEYNVTRIVGP